MYIISFRLERI